MQYLISLASTHEGAIIALATIVVAAATTATTALTFILAKENRRLRKAGTEPEVVAYLTTDPRYKTSVNFILANVGQGPARNVRFSLEADQDDFGAHSVELNNNTARTAISILPPEEKISAFLGQGHQLFKEPRLKPFVAKVEYENLNGSKRSASYGLDVSQFDGLIILGGPTDHEIAEALKRIEKHLGRFATGFRRLKVETMTAAQVRKEDEKWCREREKRRKDRARAK